MKKFSLLLACLLLAAVAQAQALPNGAYYGRSHGPFIDPPYVRAPDMNGAGKGPSTEPLKGQALTSLARKEGPSPVITGADYSLSKPGEFRYPCRYPRFIKEPTRQFPSADPSKNLSRLSDLPYLRSPLGMSQPSVMGEETTMHRLSDRYGMNHGYCR